MSTQKVKSKVEAGAIITPLKVVTPQKKKKVPKIAPQVAKKGIKQPKLNSTPGELNLLKAKLRKKYNLLKHEPLNYDDREELLTVVCTILGMNRPSLDVVLVDLLAV